jgi:uncharacterized membrane protein
MRISKLKLVLLMAMSLFGLWASGMVVFVYYTTGSYAHLPFCSSSQSSGPLAVDCAKVLGSTYSRVFGVPLELFAVVYFVINLVLVYLVAFGGDSVFRRSLTVLFGWRFIGLIIVPYLVAVELFILQAICIYCTIMHVAIVLDFIIISYFLFYKKNSLYAVAEQAPGQAAS